MELIETWRTAPPERPKKMKINIFFFVCPLFVKSDSQSKFISSGNATFSPAPKNFTAEAAISKRIMTLSEKGKRILHDEGLALSRVNRLSS
jgi:hypothetical protein